MSCEQLGSTTERLGGVIDSRSMLLKATGLVQTGLPLLFAGGGVRDHNLQGPQRGSAIVNVDL